MTVTLPPWAVTKEKRRDHIERVALLVDTWAIALGLDDGERTRWQQAAWWHDALRNEDADRLRALAPEFTDWPDKLLHGPAAAALLRADGFRDEGVLRAVTYHTIGHPEFDAAGRALYLADFLEPGRHFDPIGRAVLRARMPHDEPAVLREVLRNRITHMMASGRRIRSETLAFWNSIAD